MNLKTFIDEYLPDVEFGSGFIILLVLIILIAAVKIFLSSKNTVKTSDAKNPSLEEENDLFDLEQERQIIDESLNRVKEESSIALQSSGVSISQLKEEETLEVSELPDEEEEVIKEEVSVSEPEINALGTEDKILPALQFNDDEDLENFELFTNPKHIFSGALHEIFDKKVKIALNHMPLYRLIRFPFFKLDNNHVKRFYLDDKPDILIEELFELWRMGYKNKELPVLFIHYFYSIKSNLSLKILKSIINHNLLDESELKKILFIYGQDLGILETGEYEVESIENGYDSFIISDYIKNHNVYLNRKLWHKWENEFFNLVSEDQKGKFFVFYFDLLENQSSFIMKYHILSQYKSVLSSPWKAFIEKQAFHYGHYEKLSRLSFIPPEYDVLVSRSPATSKRQLYDLLHIISSKENFELHKFLVLHINKQKDLRSFIIDNKNIEAYMSRLDKAPSDPLYLPIGIRFILFLYFYSKNNLDQMNKLTPYIKGPIKSFLPRLYQLRIIFQNGEYERAYESIQDLWNFNEDNMLLMNETAIYAYHAGKIDEAEKLFSRLRELYPDNSQIIHNESVFLKHKSKIIAEKKRRIESQISQTADV